MVAGDQELVGLQFLSQVLTGDVVMIGRPDIDERKYQEAVSERVLPVGRVQEVADDTDCLWTSTQANDIEDKQ